MVQLYCNFISLKGTVTSSLQLSSALLYGIVSLNNVVYVSAHEDNGGIYKLTFNHGNGGLAEKILSNGGSLCNKLHSLTTYSDNSFAFSDTGDSCIKAYNPSVKQCSVIVGSGKGTRDGSKAQFSQPTGICFDCDTVYCRHLNRYPSYDKQRHYFDRLFKASTSVWRDVWTSHKEKHLGHSRDPPGNRETRASLFL